MTHNETPDWLDAAVARDPRYAAARTQFGTAIRLLLEKALNSDNKLAVLDAEQAAHAAVAAAIDAAWQLGRCGRSGAAGSNLNGDGGGRDGPH